MNCFICLSTIPFDVLITLNNPEENVSNIKFHFLSQNILRQLKIKKKQTLLHEFKVAK